MKARNVVFGMIAILAFYAAPAYGQDHSDIELVSRAPVMVLK